MNKQKQNKIKNLITELDSLVPVRYSHKSHKAFLINPVKGIDLCVRKPYGDKK